jgi:hypothetical protein
MANATNSGSNLYSTEWSGPPATNYSLSGMSGSLSALIAAIGPTQSQSSSGSAAPSNHGASVTHLHAVREVLSFAEHPLVPRGAVIGIAIAGATVVCLIVAYIITRAYRKRRQANLELPDPLEAPVSSVSMVKTVRIEDSGSRLRRPKAIRRS